MPALSCFRAKSVAPDVEELPYSSKRPKHYNRLEHKDSAVIERGTALFPILSAVGTFGASLALSSYFAARGLEDGAVTLSLFCWAYTAYAVATITTLVWQLALLSNIWIAARRPRFFRTERGVLLALGLSILSISAGTLLVSLALVQPQSIPRGTIIGAYFATGAIGFILLFTFSRFAFVWTTTERENKFLILPFNQCVKGFDDESDPEIEEFLSMYSQHGERLASLYQSSPALAERDDETAKILYYAGVGLQYEVRNKRGIKNRGKPEPPEDIATMRKFIDNSRRWRTILDMLHAADKGQFYTRPLEEQVWRFEILKGYMEESPKIETTDAS